MSDGIPPPIKGFFKQYRFLSNFHVADVEFEGIVYPSTEHAFQAAKTLNIEERKKVAAAPTPKESKYLGRRLKLREDWEEVRISVMEAVCRDKFTRHEILKACLLATGESYLEETNYWGDRFWGVDGTGENNLGKILMKIRSELRK